MSFGFSCLLARLPVIGILTRLIGIFYGLQAQYIKHNPKLYVHYFKGKPQTYYVLASSVFANSSKDFICIFQFHQYSSSLFKSLFFSFMLASSSPLPPHHLHSLQSSLNTLSFNFRELVKT
jgi:hypothetical protein